MTEATLRCPVCNERLEPARSEWNLSTCGKCGGVWTDTTAGNRAIKGLGKALVEHDHGDGAKHDDRAHRPCPICGLPLAKERHYKTTLDVCSDHGIWFDRGELRRVALRAAKPREPKEKRDPRWHDDTPVEERTASASKSSGGIGIDGAFAVVEVLVNLISLAG